MMVVNEKHFLVVLWTKNSEFPFYKQPFIKLFTNQSEVSALPVGCFGATDASVLDF